MANGGETVGYDYDCAAAIEAGEVFYDFALVAGVERVGGFVEEDEVGVAVDGTRYEDALFLPLADTDAVAADDGVVA